MIRIDSLSFSYPDHPIFGDISMELHDGELVALMGASGRGKTTLLRLISGLERPSGGVIESTHEKIAYVFQESSLFPWLTVKENLQSVVKTPNSERIQNALSMVGLSSFADAKPDQLSGGMKMRASLARAIVYDASLYLLDEPFSALDEDSKRLLIPALRKYLKEQGASAILVTHNLSDAELFSDRIIKI